MKKPIFRDLLYSFRHSQRVPLTTSFNHVHFFTLCVWISVTALLSFYGSLAVLSPIFFLNLTSFVLLLDRSESFHEDSWREGYKQFTALTIKCQDCPCCTVTHILTVLSFLSGKQM